jgi:hypothetical protein
MNDDQQGTDHARIVRLEEQVARLEEQIRGLGKRGGTVDRGVRQAIR